MDEQTQTTPPAGGSQGGQSDAEKNKAMAIIGYIFPFLFFIPLVTDAKNSPFAKFHANQQLNLLLAGIAGWVALSILSVILAVTIILIPLIPIIWLVFQIAIIALAVIGIINVSKAEMKKLPVIGGFNIIK